MRAANAASQALTSLIQSQSQENKGKGKGAVKGEDEGEKARKALGELRALRPGALDVERAAGSVVGKLVQLELVSLSCDCISGWVEG